MWRLRSLHSRQLRLVSLAVVLPVLNYVLPAHITIVKLCLVVVFVVFLYY
jgi:hypothetical protein